MFSALTKKKKYRRPSDYVILNSIDVCNGVLYLYSYNSFLHLQIAGINHVVVFTSRDGHEAEVYPVSKRGSACGLKPTMGAKYVSNRRYN